MALSMYYIDKHLLQDPYDPSGLRHGAWEVGLCDCASCVPMSACCCVAPSIALAQIAVRLGRRSYGAALARELVLALLILGTPGAMVATIQALLAFSARGKDNAPEATFTITALWVLGCVWLAAVTMSGLSIMDKRARLRERFAISGSRAADCASVACLPTCAIAQMAAHVRCFQARGCNMARPEELPAYTL